MKKLFAISTCALAFAFNGLAADCTCDPCTCGDKCECKGKCDKEKCDKGDCEKGTAGKKAEDAGKA